jgi:Transposase IS66 family
MDETPIKAGRSGHGKMHTGYFWPIYGEHDEVCFPFHASRSADFVCHALGIKPVVNAVLLTDGYAAYEYHAQCAFQMIRVDRNLRIGEEDFETDTPLAHIVQRLNKRVNSTPRRPGSITLDVGPTAAEVFSRR